MDILYENSPFIFENDTTTNGDTLSILYGGVTESVVIVNNIEIFF